MSSANDKRARDSCSAAADGACRNAPDCRRLLRYPEPELQYARARLLAGVVAEVPEIDVDRSEAKLAQHGLGVEREKRGGRLVLIEEIADLLEARRRGFLVLARHDISP